MSQLCFFTFLSLFSLFGFEPEESDAISPSFVVLSWCGHIFAQIVVLSVFLYRNCEPFFGIFNATRTFGVNISA